MVQKAYGVKITREENTGQDWGQALIFTYRNQHDCLTNNKRQRLVDATVPQKFALVGATVNRLSMLAKVAKEKIFFFPKHGPDMLL